MRARIHFHAKALLFSLSAVSFTLVATFFFYDGPIRLPRMEETVQAKELIKPDNEPFTTANAQRSASPLEGLLPDEFQHAWKPVSLDNNKIRLQMLTKPFLLSHTSHQTGSEAFEYASFLFEQMAKGIKNSDLSTKVATLSLQAQTLGNAVRQASEFRFDGPPSTDMEHLQVRSAILFHLKGLNPNALVSAQYNQHGRLMTETMPGKATQGGDDVKAFMNKVNAVLNHPEARHYPATMQLLRQESALLQNLASHLTLRWESTLYCQRSCDSIATYMRVYTRQTLPAKTLAAVLP